MSRVAKLQKRYRAERRAHRARRTATLPRRAARRLGEGLRFGVLTPSRPWLQLSDVVGLVEGMAEVAVPRWRAVIGERQALRIEELGGKVPDDFLRIVAVCWKCGEPLADTLERRGPDGYSCAACPPRTSP